MPDRARIAVASALAGYNLLQNLALPAPAYVPANLLAAAGLVALGRRYGCTWNELGLDPSRVRPGLRLGLIGAAGAMAAALATIGNRSTGRLLLDERAADQAGRDVVFRALVRFPLGTALFEEVAFRGVLSGMWLRAGASARRASGVTALAFALWHLIPTRDALSGNPLDSRFTTPAAKAGVVATGALLTGISSFGLSWMRERSGSLVAPWMTHAAINSVGYLAGVAAWRRANATAGAG